MYHIPTSRHSGISRIEAHYLGYLASRRPSRKQPPRVCILKTYLTLSTKSRVRSIWRSRIVPEPKNYVMEDAVRVSARHIVRVQVSVSVWRRSHKMTPGGAAGECQIHYAPSLRKSTIRRPLNTRCESAAFLLRKVPLRG